MVQGPLGSFRGSGMQAWTCDRGHVTGAGVLHAAGRHGRMAQSWQRSTRRSPEGAHAITCACTHVPSSALSAAAAPPSQRALTCAHMVAEVTEKTRTRGSSPQWDHTKGPQMDQPRWFRPTLLKWRRHSSCARCRLMQIRPAALLLPARGVSREPHSRSRRVVAMKKERGPSWIPRLPIGRGVHPYRPSRPAGVKAQPQFS